MTPLTPLTTRRRNTPSPRRNAVNKVSQVKKTPAETQRLTALYQRKLAALKELKKPCCTRPSAPRCEAETPLTK